DPSIAGANIELGTFAGSVPQVDQHRSGGVDKRPARASTGQPTQPHEAGTEHETPAVIAIHQEMTLQGQRQTVGGGSRQPGGLGQLVERKRPGFESAENGYHLVQHSDTAYTLSH